MLNFEIQKMKKIITLSIALNVVSLMIIAQPLIPNVQLNNGVLMPILGFGTLDLKDNIGVNSVANAISLGYRLIDTATIYGNEEAVGDGIKQSGIDRHELFITTKLWVDDMGYNSAKLALNVRVSKDRLYRSHLIHRPR